MDRDIVETHSFKVEKCKDNHFPFIFFEDITSFGKWKEKDLFINYFIFVSEINNFISHRQLRKTFLECSNFSNHWHRTILPSCTGQFRDSKCRNSIKFHSLDFMRSTGWLICYPKRSRPWKCREEAITWRATDFKCRINSWYSIWMLWSGEIRGMEYSY